MAVVGFDFGNESCVIACIRKKKIEVLQNETGSRKTSTCVGFSGNQRNLGSAGIASYSSNYKNSITNFKRLIGRQANKRFFDEEAPFLTTKVTEEKGSGLMVHVKYDSKTRQFPPESLAAMQLGRLKRTAEASLGISVKDCVIGVPSYWNDQMRRAMLNAAKIAGLNVMRLMNETTAVALNYGILRTINTDIKVLFVDMGCSSLNVSLVTFAKGKLQVLASATDANLGGRNFDKLLMDHFADYIKKKYKMDVYSNPKATLKLRKECTRVKKVLSANKKVIFNVEYIMNDTDVKGEITRETFETMAASLLARMLAPLKQVLSDALVQKSELHSLEVVGGAVRIPCVKSMLTKWFEKPVSATCDGDESVARGCALQCAMLAPFVKVRDFEVNDITPYGIQLYWQDYSPTDERTLAEIWDENCTNSPVPAHNPIPSKKLITFKDKTKPFQVIAKYNDDVKLPADTELFLGRWVIDNIPPSKRPENEGKAPKLKVKFQLDINGIFSVSSVTSVESYEIEVEEEVKVEIKPDEKENKDNMEVDPSTDGKAESKGTDQTTDQPKAETSDQAKAEASTSTTSTSTTDTTNTTSQPTTNPADQTTETATDMTDEAVDETKDKDQKNQGKDKDDKKTGKDEKMKDGDEVDTDKKDKQDKPETKKSEAKKAEKKVEKPKYRYEKIMKRKQKKTKIDLSIKEQDVSQMDLATVQIWRKEEVTMQKKDKEIQETNELRNSLEGYVLEMRGKLESSLAPYMPDTPREKFIKELNDMEEWLYEDGYDAEKLAFEERLKKLKITGDPVDKRSDEAKRRPQCVRDLNRAIAESKALVESKDKKYDHITQEERKTAFNKCLEAQTWLTAEVKKQDPLSLSDDPVLLCSSLVNKKRDIKKFCDAVMSKPKPKPKPKPKAEKKDKDKDKDQDKKEKTSDDDKKINGDGKKNTEKKTDPKPDLAGGFENDPTMDLGCD